LDTNSVLNIEQNDINFTNERLVINKYVKENFGEVLEEHISRYAHACKYVKGKKVLDAACGSGYGSKMIKEAGAEFVIGLDISDESINNASVTYGSENIKFISGDVNNTGFENNFFDVVVSYETIEHIDSGKVWIGEASRILSENGLFIVSSPNRTVTNHLLKFGDKVRNPYHKFEYTLQEFLGELTTKFDIVDLYGQTFIPNYVMSSHVTNVRILKYYYTTFVSNTTTSGGGIKRVMQFGKSALKKVFTKSSNKENYDNKKNKVIVTKPEKIETHKLINLSEIKDMQPMYIIAVCKKKSGSSF